MATTARTVVVWGLGFLLFGCAPDFERLEGPTMGTSYSLIYGECQVAADEVEDILAAINRAVSTYDPDSEISVFNRAPENDAVLMSEHFAVTMHIADEIWRQSNGALDPTVGPLVDLWGFGPVDDAQEPDASQQARVADLIGWQKVNLDADNVSKRVSGLRLDLSAIAKGYAVDEVGRYLAASGCDNYMVDIGGEMVTSGTNPRGAVWRVGIERPDPDALGAIQLVLQFSNMAIATSGDYRNYRIIDGRRIDHVMDLERVDQRRTVLYPRRSFTNGPYLRMRTRQLRWSWAWMRPWTWQTSRDLDCWS